MLTQWGIFGLSALTVIVAGYKLGQYADEIAEATGIARAWIGMLLLATVTSLPELSTTVTAGAIVAPEIALGNIFGSNLFNMALLFVMEAVAFWILRQRSASLFSRAGTAQLLYAAVAIGLTALAVAGVGIGGGEFLGLGPMSWVILALYPLSIWILYRPSGGDAAAGSPDPRKAILPLLKFALAGTAVVIAGIYLARSGKEISLHTRLTGTFMGAFFIAASTSLPELMSCLGALRLGAVDLLVGNLFGSNMFNVFTIPFADLAYRGSLLAAGSREQMTVAALSIVLMTVAAFGIARRPRRRILGISPEAWGLLLVYLVAIYVLFSRGIEF